MLIKEVADVKGDASSNAKTLLALSQFLLGRANDTASKKQISQTAFIDLAKSLGVNVTPDNIADIVAQPPLDSIIEPFDPAEGIVKFKGNDDAAPAQMTVPDAQKVVDKNAKSALKRRT